MTDADNIESFRAYINACDVRWEDMTEYEKPHVSQYFMRTNTPPAGAAPSVPARLVSPGGAL